MPKDMRTWIRELENAGDVAATCSASELTFIVIMASNPEPSYRVTFQITQSTIASCETHRPNAFFLIDTLKM